MIMFAQAISGPGIGAVGMRLRKASGTCRPTFFGLHSILVAENCAAAPFAGMQRDAPSVSSSPGAIEVKAVGGGGGDNVLCWVPGQVQQLGLQILHVMISAV